MALLTVYIVGGACDVLGVVLAGWGIRQTWGTHQPDRSMVGEWIRPVRSYAATKSRWLKHRIAKLLGIRVDQTIHVGSINANLQFGTAAVITGHAPFDPLPNPEDDAAAFAAEINRRLSEVRREAHEAKLQATRETRDRERDLGAVRADLTENVARLDERTKLLATDGLVLQMWGLFFIALGVALGAAGNIWSVLGGC